MPSQKPLATYDSRVTFSYVSPGQQFGDAVLLGEWFVFIKPTWMQQAGLMQLLALSGVTQPDLKPAILFRGNKKIQLPGVEIAPTPFPQPALASLTCDKQLYRANRDTIRLLIAAPLKPNATLRLKLQLSGNAYADYPLTLDAYGLCLWPMRDLPEGEYAATLDGLDADVCRFEVAEYRLAALNAELAEQQLIGDILGYTLSITAFGQPYQDDVEIELQERGQRVGQRERLHCQPDGTCRGSVKFTGSGPYTLNVIAGERTATIALKGSEQQRRETLIISALGNTQELSLLPLPQADECRGMYVAQSGVNTEPIVASHVIGNELELTVRADMDLLRLIMVDPTRDACEGSSYEQVKTGQKIILPVPSPYGVVLLGALMDGKAWEGWCAALRPSTLQLACEAPAEARPGSRMTITLKTGMTDRVVPVQLIVKDQRLIAPSDPLVEFAACIKKNLTEWSKQTTTGIIERMLGSVQVPPSPPYMYQSRVAYAAAPMAPPPMPFGAAPTSMPPPPTGRPMASLRSVATSASTAITGAFEAVRSPAPQASVTQTQSMGKQTATTTIAPTSALAKVRLQFPEIVYNNVLYVKGEERVEIKLGESMTRYSIEAFALSSETLDWQRAETSVNAVQPVYGELTVSPFVFAGDPVMGRLDVGAASGKAVVEIRHDGELLPLHLDDGSMVVADSAIPSGAVVRFPVRPGTITAMVRDAQTGEVDVSERYVTEPGSLRHITRRMRLLIAGDEVTLQELHALELQPMPGLERPFQFFVEGAAKYPFG